MKPPKIVVAGGSGFIGRPLCRALWDNGRREVWALSRTAREIPYARVVRWDGHEPGPWLDCLEGADAVINLCGAGFPGGRWTASRIRELHERRVTPARMLVEAMWDERRRPRVFVSASKVEYYGDRGGETLDESAPAGAGTLAELCAEWEKTALAAPKDVRTVVLRTGLVIGQGGGGLQPLLPCFRLCLEGPLGGASRYVSWIAREDVVGLILHALEKDVSGPLNATAPEPVSSATFSRELAAALRRPCALRLPGGVVKMAFGELAESLLGGQRALPTRAELAGYAFKRPELRQALEEAVRYF